MIDRLNHIQDELAELLDEVESDSELSAALFTAYEAVATALGIAGRRP